VKTFVGAIALLVAAHVSAAPITIDFENVAGLTPLNSNTQGSPLAPTSAIVGEIPGVVISSVGPFKNSGVDLDGDGSTNSFSGVAWLDFTGTTSTAHSGSRVIAGASGGDSLDFTSFVEFRLPTPTIHSFKIWVELLPGGGLVDVLFRDDLNGSKIVQEIKPTTSGFVSFSSATAFQNVLFLPTGGARMWLDDLTLDTDGSGGGGGGGGGASPVPEPAPLALLGLGLAGIGFLRRKH